MADGFDIDSRELDRLAADLGEVADTAGRYVRAAVEVSARRVKDDWRSRAKGFLFAPAFPRSITYDVDTFQGFGASVLQADIGPDKAGPQGALGNLIEYGSVNNPPMGLGHAALQANEADFEHGLSEALLDAEAVLRANSSVVSAAAAVIRGRFR